jgi:formate dehydrogenase accessory protein FdhD
VNDGLRTTRALRIDGGHACEHDSLMIEDMVIEESPVALLYNGLPFAVMMATPVDLEDFALGFALCEGIVGNAGEFSLVDVVRDDAGVALHAAIPQVRFDLLEDRRRTLEGRSGCGLCGVAELREAVRPPPHVGIGGKIAPGEIHAALETVSRQQPMNARSGGVHAAGFVRGDAAWVREDVGRHNAVDKLVGALHREMPAVDATDGMLVVTSRASYEIVRKAAFAGIPVVVAMSAPTAQAIAQAEAAGITLVAFARDARMTVYAGRERIVLA